MSAEQSKRPTNSGAFPEDLTPRGVDVENDTGSDSTIDTDGKGRDTRRQAAGDLDRLNDNEVVTNATLQNAVLTPPSGLAGIDSRPRGAGTDVVAEPGSRVVDAGFVEAPGLYESAGDDAEADPIEHAAKQRDHVPENHTRVGHHIRIEPGNDATGRTKLQ
jgi:hypothetical protein